MIDPYALGLNVVAISGDEARIKCNFHDDHSPSATFNINSGLFYCFTCGASYTAQTVAQLLGGVVTHRQTPMQIIRGTAEWRWILSMPLALENEYLDVRGVTNAQVNRYGLRNTGLGIAFPVHNIQGTLLGFQERRYDGTERYHFWGRRFQVWPAQNVVGLPPAQFIVEGVFGVLNAERCGIKAVTPMGAGAIVHAGEIVKQRIKILFDDDYAGYLAAAKGLVRWGWPMVVPGAEADELTQEQWNNLMEMRSATTRVGLAADLSGDPMRFMHELSKFTSKDHRRLR